MIQIIYHNYQQYEDTSIFLKNKNQVLEDITLKTKKSHNTIFLFVDFLHVFFFNVQEQIGKRFLTIPQKENNNKITRFKITFLCLKYWKNY